MIFCLWIFVQGACPVLSTIQTNTYEVCYTTPRDRKVAAFLVTDECQARITGIFNKGWR